jgi:hypothetical protein
MIAHSSQLLQGQEHDRKKIDLLKKLFPVLDEHEIIEVLEVRISPTLT